MVQPFFSFYHMELEYPLSIWVFGEPLYLFWSYVEPYLWLFWRRFCLGLWSGKHLLLAECCIFFSKIPNIWLKIKNLKIILFGFYLSIDLIITFISVETSRNIYTFASNNDDFLSLQNTFCYYSSKSSE